MVKWKGLVMLFLISLVCWYDLAAAIKVAAEIEATRSSEHRALRGSVYIYHQDGAKIDAASFELEKKPLAIEFVETRKPTAGELRLDSSLNPGSTVSVYRFTLPGKDKGLYILPSISVLVDGKRYKSVATTYEVTVTQASQDLELEAIVEGQPPFYPGQHVTLRYRIYYNRNIELTEEHLPLLQAEGFQKVGEKNIRDYQTATHTVQEISQEVRAIEPGHYTYGPSIIEGVSYQEDILGKRKYDKTRLRASAPAVPIEVTAFPEEGKPASFTGAVGAFSIKARLLTPTKVTMGEKIEVGVRLTGGPDLEDVIFPQIDCQPGFSGFFQFDAFPPFEQQENQSREFIFNLRPLSAHLTDIPPIEFSYFDPQAKEYKSIQTSPLPISVESVISYKAETRSGRPEVIKFGPKQDQSAGLVQDQENVSGVDWRAWMGYPSPPKLASVYVLTPKDLVSSPWGIRATWIALAAALTLILLQLLLSRFQKARPKPARTLVSYDYMTLAAQAKHDPARACMLIEEAFLQLVVEKGWYPKKPSTPDALATEGIVGEIRAYLTDLAGKRYGGETEVAMRDVLRSAKELYRRTRYEREP